MASKNKEQRYSDLDFNQKRIILQIFIDVMIDPEFEEATLKAVHQEGVDRLNKMILSKFGINKTAIPDYNWAKTDNSMSLKSLRASIDKWNNRRFTMHFLSDDGFPMLPVKPTPEDHKEYELKKKYISVIESELEGVRSMLRIQFVNGMVSTIRDVYWFARLRRMYSDPDLADATKSKPGRDSDRAIIMGEVWEASKAYSREELAFELTSRKGEKFDTSSLDAKYIYFPNRDARLEYSEEGANSVGIQHNIAMSLGLVPPTKEDDLGVRRYANRLPVGTAGVQSAFVFQSTELDYVFDLMHKREDITFGYLDPLVLLAWRKIINMHGKNEDAFDKCVEVLELHEDQYQLGEFESNLKIQELCGLGNLKYKTDEIYLDDPFDKNQQYINFNRRNDNE